MSLLGILLENLKRFWRLTRNRVTEFLPRRQSNADVRPAPVVDIAEAREQGRAAWVELVRKRAPHLLARGRGYPPAGWALPVRTEPTANPVVKSAVLQTRPKARRPVPTQVPLRETEPASSRSRGAGGEESPLSKAFLPIGRSKREPAPGFQPIEGEVLLPLADNTATASRSGDTRFADRPGAPSDGEAVEPRPLVVNDPSAGPKHLFPKPLPPEQVLESPLASVTDPDLQRDLGMPVATEGAAADFSPVERAFGETFFAAAENMARDEPGAAMLQTAPGSREEEARLSDFKAVPRTDVAAQSLELESWIDPFADSSRARFAVADEDRNPWAAPSRDVRRAVPSPPQADSEDRWPPLLPDRQPEMDDQPRSLWNEIAYRHRLMEEQRGM